MQQANEFENNLMQQLHTLTSCTWQEQVEIIKSIKPSPQIVKLINHRNYSSEIANLFAAHYPRTKLITVLSDFLVELFSIAANQLIGFANLLVSSECLIRLLASGNKVVSSCANEIIKSIIGNLDFSTKAKQVKFVSILQQEFLTSKNSYEREKISLYFLLISTSFYYSTKDSLADFERKVVKEGLQDANQKVRANMRQILENIHHFEKQNSLIELQKCLSRKATQKSSLKSTKITKKSHQNKSFKALNTSSVNQSSIVDSFIDQDKIKHNRDIINEESFRFQLQRLKSGETWRIIQLAYEVLIEAINNGFLAQVGKDELYCETLQAISMYLSEKRSKIYQSCSKMFNNILIEVSSLKRDKVIGFCQQQSLIIIQQVIKNQSVGNLILPTMINLNPSFFIAKIAQISTSIKAPREKLLLLDSIVTNIHHIIDEPLSIKGNKKISTLVKSMCHHVQKSTLKQKQVSLAALAIISQLKFKFPEQVLTALLCQSDKSLSRILQLAESIDPSLKTAIIDYINSLKVSSKKNSTCQSRSQLVENRPLSEIIQLEMIKISRQQSSNLNKLGQLLLTHVNELDSKIFQKLIGLLQFLCSSDLIMEYKILMQQLVKLSQNEFVKAITQALESGNSDGEAKVREFHDLMLLELLQLVAKQQKLDSQMLGNIIVCLIKVYRSSQSIKKRNLTIQIMTKFDQTELCKLLTQEQLLLTQTYKVHLESSSE